MEHSLKRHAMDESSDYRQFLNKEWVDRNNRNSSYSKRAFARDLGIAPSHLVQVFSGKKELGENIAEKILDRIEWSEEKKRIFWLLFRLQKTKSIHLKNSLVKKYREALQQEQNRQLSQDEFHLISDWFHYAIVELAHTSDFVPNPEWISKRLHIDLKLATKALDSLLRLGLLEKTKQGIQASTKLYTTTQDIPSEAIRSNHLQHLHLAETALKNQTVDQRDFSGMTFCIDPSRLPEAKKKIQRFRRELMTFLEGGSGSRSQVYRLNLQLFRLDFEIEESNRNDK